MEHTHLKIQAHRLESFVISADIADLHGWFKDLLGRDFNEWVRDFNFIRWLKTLGDLTYLQLVQGFIHFSHHRENIISESVRPFPMNCIKFKEICKVLLSEEELILICSFFDDSENL